MAWPAGRGGGSVGTSGPPQLLAAAQARQLPILRVEDGFLRSVGLGADLIDPISWVVDRSGMYYDASGPSDLETLLAQTDWSTAQLHRAAALRRLLVEQAITKYNLPETDWQRPAAARRVVLVVGQVESDASIRYGAPGLNSNMALLQAVRQAEPDALLVYKPHPDVVAGLCRPGRGEVQAEQLCDVLLTAGSIQALFSQVDALHVLTSLAGFEALLRGGGALLGAALLCRLGVPGPTGLPAPWTLPAAGGPGAWGVDRLPPLRQP